MKIKTEEIDRVFQDIKDLAQVIGNLKIELTLDEVKLAIIILEHIQLGKLEELPKQIASLPKLLKSKAGEIIVREE